MIADQTFCWLSRFKKILNSMGKNHFHFILHRLIKKRNLYTEYCHLVGKYPLLPSAKLSTEKKSWIKYFEHNHFILPFTYLHYIKWENLKTISLLYNHIYIMKNIGPCGFLGSEAGHSFHCIFCLFSFFFLSFYFYSFSPTSGILRKLKFCLSSYLAQQERIYIKYI